MTPRGRGLAAVLSLILFVFAAPATAEEIARGEVLLTKYCASCHALGQMGPSPHPEAPPFRTLGKLYPIESLEEALAEGMMTGHPDMPEFAFDADDVGAIIAFLNSIQAR